MSSGSAAGSSQDEAAQILVGCNLAQLLANVGGIDAKRLPAAILHDGEVLHEAVKRRGSSLADQQYRDLYGKVGEYQHEHHVYAREGQPCSRCQSRERSSQRCVRCIERSV